MLKQLFSLLLCTTPLMAELSYFSAQPAKIAPEELLGYRSELMEALSYNPGKPDAGMRARAMELIQENKNGCVNDYAAHDGIIFTPLYLACVLKDAELVKALLDQGANPDHPSLHKLNLQLTPEIIDLLENARKTQKAQPVTREEWVRRYNERIGGQLFWSGDEQYCASVTQSEAGRQSHEIWCLKTDTHGRLMPIGLCVVRADGYQVEEVQLHNGIMTAILSKPGMKIQASLYYAFHGYILYDFNQRPTDPVRQHSLGHPFAELSMYAKLAELVEF